MSNPPKPSKKSLMEPSRGERGRFKSLIDVSNINPYELLQILMQIRGYSYAELGREFGGYSKSSIYRIFHGTSIPKRKIQKEIAEFFKLPMDFIWKL
jgi:antitoxin component HigA of HigAB toxin-antitoxin module